MQWVEYYICLITTHKRHKYEALIVPMDTRGWPFLSETAQTKIASAITFSFSHQAMIGSP